VLRSSGDLLDRKIGYCFKKAFFTTPL